jgi:polysaccharide deacetylase family protein (PEP-CTERM system associated)
VLAYEVGPEAFREDIVRAKKVLEDLTGEEVTGFRAPGFSVRDDSRWLFDAVAEAGYRYDASVFPTHHGHGGLRGVNPDPHRIETRGGTLVEIPMSTVSILRRRICLFGGGYLRLAPLRMIQWGAEQLRRAERPLIVYTHPREIDPEHPRLPLRPMRRFKCYVKLKSTMPKLKWLCEHHRFTTMQTIAAQVEAMAGAGRVSVEAVPQRTSPSLARIGARKPRLTPEHMRSSQ